MMLSNNLWNSFDTSTNGGFVPEGNKGSTSKKKEQVRRIQSVVPLFISHITESTDEEFKLYGMPVQIAEIVGVLKHFEVQSTKANCIIEDESASIKGIMWLESDNDIVAIPPVKEDSYVHVFGSIRTQDGEKMLMIIRIRPIVNLDIVTNHRLEVCHAKTYAESLMNGGLPEEDLTKAVPDTSMSFSDFGTDGPSALPALKPIQLKILNLLKPVKNSEGLSKAMIMKNFQPSQARDVESALAFLLDEGHAYTTVDSEHFKAT